MSAVELVEKKMAEPERSATLFGLFTEFDTGAVSLDLRLRARPISRRRRNG